MLKVGDSVVHPTFPDWGKGIISQILFDNVSGKSIARVMWQSLNTDKLAFHTLSNLQKFKD
jgi:hypothetical protein